MQHFRGNVFVYQGASSEPIALESIVEIMGERKRSMLLDTEKVCAAYAKQASLLNYDAKTSRSLQIYERAVKSGYEMARERMVSKCK